jgi:hypothetical protein
MDVKDAGLLAAASVLRRSGVSARLAGASSGDHAASRRRHQPDGQSRDGQAPAGRRSPAPPCARHRARLDLIEAQRVDLRTLGAQALRDTVELVVVCVPGRHPLLPVSSWSMQIGLLSLIRTGGAFSDMLALAAGELEVLDRQLPGGERFADAVAATLGSQTASGIR